VALPAEFDSRNNRLARLALDQDGFLAAVAQAIDRYGAQRCGVILGTSTSSMGRTEDSYRRLDVDGKFLEADRNALLHCPHSTTEYAAGCLGIIGPAATVSTACSSSARVFSSAARWLECSIVDAVVVGGVDSLCLGVICGFHSLQLVSPDPCKPFDVERNGLNLGEAGGFALLTSDLSDTDGSPTVLLGHGESQDAHHMSSAHPEGLGAKLAMKEAAGRAGMSLGDIDYLNLHGTGTRLNDSIEGLACGDLFGEGLLCSATKSWTGHTLGAAGITEAVLAMETLSTGTVPGTINTRSIDPEIQIEVLLENRSFEPEIVMTNSFGFGGNNCSLIFARAGQ
jgi:3-oxoacyl-[acyl-carrier-protein] synthase-1